MGKLFLGAVSMVAVFLAAFFISSGIVAKSTYSGGLVAIIAIAAGLVLTVIVITRAEYPTPHMITSSFVVAVAAAIAAAGITFISSAAVSPRSAEKMAIGIVAMVFALVMSCAAMVITEDCAKMNKLPWEEVTVICVVEYAAIVLTMAAKMP